VNIAFWLAVIAVILSGLIIGGIFERKRLHPFLIRGCSGRKWKAQFPDATNDEIRNFLNVFGFAFGFSRRKLLKFGSDDKIMDIYYALYPELKPPRSFQIRADALELETFAKEIQHKFAIDLASVWKPELTLGQIFAMTRQGSPAER
jgi:hypothetical protein